jgi:hypothetical protein
MKIFSLVAFVLCAAPVANADGTLAIVVNPVNGGFSTLQLVEKGGVRQGTVNGVTVASQLKGNTLYLQTGDFTETLSLTKEQGNIHYQGILDQCSELSDFWYYPGTNGYEIKGSVAGSQFDLYYDQTKGVLDLNWDDKADNATFDIELKKTSATEAGSCSGDMTVTVTPQDGGPPDVEQLATLFCHSSGSLADALFDSPNDAIAWLIHINVQPANNPEP